MRTLRSLSAHQRLILKYGNDNWKNRFSQEKDLSYYTTNEVIRNKNHNWMLCYIYTLIWFNYNCKLYAYVERLHLLSESNVFSNSSLLGKPTCMNFHSIIRYFTSYFLFVHFLFTSLSQSCCVHECVCLYISSCTFLIYLYLCMLASVYVLWVREKKRNRKRLR